MKTTISRREMLQIIGATGALAGAGTVGRAMAQPAGKIERLDPALDRVLSLSQSVQELGSGPGGAVGPAEGPLW